jgi:septin family protein
LCLYFIEGPRIKDLDKRTLFELQKYVNIIPILARADSYSVEEILEAKLRIIEECYDAGIQFFDCAKAMRLDVNDLEGIGPCPPFAVVTSTELIQKIEGDFCYGRKYPWGVCDINNPLHSDFALLYRLLIGYFSQPCIESTKEIYQ